MHDGWRKYLATDESTAELPVFVFGQSLGASLAIKYAQLDERFNERFEGLITEAAFSRYDSIAKTRCLQSLAYLECTVSGQVADWPAV